MSDRRTPPTEGCEPARDCPARKEHRATTDARFRRSSTWSRKRKARTAPGSEPDAEDAQDWMYRNRNYMIEPVFGHSRHNRGVTRFLRRGRKAVRTAGLRNHPNSTQSRDGRYSARTSDLLLVRGVGRRSSICGFPGLFWSPTCPPGARRLSDLADHYWPSWPQIGLSGLWRMACLGARVGVATAVARLRVLRPSPPSPRGLHFAPRP
jgi:hypothetical protein